MQYIALLRGINVGGTNKVAMQQLKTACEKMGLKNVQTYINSGNILYNSPATSTKKLAHTIEKALEQEFGLRIKTLVCEATTIANIVQTLPDHWINDPTMKCDVMFLWDNYDNPHILEQLTIKPGIDNVIYVNGALIWSVDRPNITKSGMMKLVGTDLYKHMTIRNCNTVRKLAQLLKQPH